MRLNRTESMTGHNFEWLVCLRRRQRWEAICPFYEWNVWHLPMNDWPMRLIILWPRGNLTSQWSFLYIRRRQRPCEKYISLQFDRSDRFTLFNENYCDLYLPHLIRFAINLVWRHIFTFAVQRPRVFQVRNKLANRDEPYNSISFIENPNGNE